MGSPDRAFESLAEITEEFADFCKSHGNVSESDTRAKLIDKILKEVCKWPESLISRESHGDSGYMDYCLSVHGKRLIVVEAKKEGITFETPVTKNRKLKISGPLLTKKSINEAIKQVRSYCDDYGIRFAIATNGYTWIIFRAIREDKGWREGHAAIFKDLNDISENFTEFWNLMSYDAVSKGSLEGFFSSSAFIPRELRRVVDSLDSPEKILERNKFHLHVPPLIEMIFKDIGNQPDVDILKSCYVHSDTLKVIANDLQVTIEDSIPNELKNEGTRQISVRGRYESDVFSDLVGINIQNRSGEIFLLLGGIGSGKTTFLRRYQKTIGKKTLKDHTIWVHLDFLTAPQDLEKLEKYIWQSILDQIRTRYKDMRFETRQNLKGAFADKIRMLKETRLKGLQKDSEQYNEILYSYLQEWSDDVYDYTPRLLRQVSKSCERKIILFIDNVDQMDLELQAKVFLLAQKVSNDINSLSIVSLREESYFTSHIRKVFTAYTTRKFHIASPKFRPVITKRIKYALAKVLPQVDSQVNNKPLKNLGLYKEDLNDFLKIIQDSVFHENQKIARFIDSVCVGNIRMALEMFATFLCSGTADVDKMLTIYRRDGYYSVAYHEWVKSIALGEKFYYHESKSPIMNVFDCGADKNSSHFTSLRILHMLASRRSEQTPIGKGFYSITKAANSFEDTFDNGDDFMRSLNRLVTFQLIELDNRATDNINEASDIRITASGWYYLRHLTKSFVYLDLVLQDTPLNDFNVSAILRDSVKKVDNLFDHESQKLKRLHERFKRVDVFLEYLNSEERREFRKYRLGKTHRSLGVDYTTSISSRFQKEKKVIIERVTKYLDD